MVDTSSALPVQAGADPLGVVRAPVNALLAEFLIAREEELVALDERLAPVVQSIRDLVLAGGKRMRAAFVYWGYRASGAPHTERLWHTAAAFELLQSFALIHDDVMDRSAQRRGQSAVHVALADHHRAAALCGDADWFGVGGAIRDDARVARIIGNEGRARRGRGAAPKIDQACPARATFGRS